VSLNRKQLLSVDAVILFEKGVGTLNGRKANMILSALAVTLLLAGTLAYVGNFWESTKAADLEPTPHPLIILDIYTQKGGKGWNVPGGEFEPQENVILYAEAKYARAEPTSNNLPIENLEVTFEVTGPTNSYQNFSAVLKATTNALSIASTTFLVPMFAEHAAYYGIWTVSAGYRTLDMATEGDTMTFEVASASQAPEYPIWSMVLLVFILTTAGILILTKFRKSED
jgi:hypothetical protein